MVICYCTPSLKQCDFTALIYQTGKIKPHTLLLKCLHATNAFGILANALSNSILSVSSNALSLSYGVPKYCQQSNGRDIHKNHSAQGMVCVE